ncbi:MAG: hypothetical protein AAB515_02695 [Patescibacteria group bacterium]
MEKIGGGITTVAVAVWNTTQQADPYVFIVFLIIMLIMITNVHNKLGRSIISYGTVALSLAKVVGHYIIR